MKNTFSLWEFSRIWETLKNFPHLQIAENHHRVGSTFKKKKVNHSFLANLNALWVVSFQFLGWPCQVKVRIDSLFDTPDGEVEDRIVLVSFFTCVWFEPHWINLLLSLPLCVKWQLSSNCKTMKIFMWENSFVSVFLSQSINLLLSTL